MNLLEDIKKTYIIRKKTYIKRLIITKILKYEIILSCSSTHDTVYFLLVSWRLRYLNYLLYYSLNHSKVWLLCMKTNADPQLSDKMGYLTHPFVWWPDHVSGI